MFCKNCGTQNPDHAAFCKKCGSKLTVPVQVSPGTRPTHPAPRSSLREKRIGIIVAAAAAILVLVVLFSCFSGRSYQATVKQFVNAQFDGDAEKIVQLVPKPVVKYALKKEGFDDLDELIEEGNETVQNYLRSIERYLGTDWSVSYKISSAEDLPKQELDSLKKAYKKYGVKVSAAKTIGLELTLHSAKTTQPIPMDITLIKVGNSWYLDFDSAGSIF